LSGDWTGATVVHRAERWIINNETITSHSGTTINFSYLYYAPRQDYKFFITDDLDCVTAYGEWYWDDATDRLYVYFGSFGTSPVTYSVNNNAVLLGSVSGVTIRNLDLQFANNELVRINVSPNARIEYCSMTYAYDGIYLGAGNSSGLYIGNNVIRFINNNGVKTEDGTCDGLVMELNTIAQIGSLYGEGGNNDGTYQGFNGGGGFIATGPTTNAIIRYNNLDTIGYVGIGIGGENTLIQNNIINQFCYLKDDGGAIYGAGHGTNKRWTGNIISNGAVNAWKGTSDQNIFAYGAYCDNNSKYYTIDNNTFIAVPKAIFLHDAQNCTVRDNMLYDNRQYGIFLLRSGLGEPNEPGMNVRSLVVKNNVVVGLGTTERILDVENLYNSDNIANWGSIDSNYYIRPLDDNYKIYAGYSSGGLYNMSGWRAFAGHDLNSQNAPKTFLSTINPYDSIKVFYNSTTVPTTVPIPGRWIDHKGNEYVNSVNISPYRSIILFADGATGDYVPPPPGGTVSGFVTWETPIDSDFELFPGQEAYGGIRKKLTSSQSFLDGTVASQQTIKDGESFEFQASFQSADYITVGLHPFNPGQIIDNPAVLWALRGGNTTPPQTENGILPYEAGVHLFSEYEPNSVDSPWYRFKYEAGRIKYGKSVDGGITFSDFYTSTILPSGEYRFIFHGYDPGDHIRRVRKVSPAPDTTQPPVNVPPVVTLGNNIEINLPTSSVQLTGVGSDPDGQIVGWQWMQIGGPNTGVFSDPGNNITSFSGLVAGTYTVSLTGFDNYGYTGADTMTVTVVPAANVPPSVNAGADRTVQLPTNTVTLTAVGADPDGTIVLYAWAKVSGSGSTITSPSSATTTITNLSAGAYVFRVTVTDNSGASSSDTLTVTVLSAPNTPPVVNAGADQAITLPTSSVTFSGSATDADGSIVSYLWTKISGPSGGTIASPAAASTLVTGLATAGTYTFRLLATDNSGGTGSDFINVVVSPQPVGTAYVAAVTKTWGTEIPTPRLKVRIAYTDGSQQTISYRNGAYVKGVRARYKYLEGGNRLVVIINYSDNTVQEIYKK
jgi:parallel beta-helix repeat protein